MIDPYPWWPILAVLTFVLGIIFLGGIGYMELRRQKKVWAELEAELPKKNN